jgi:hypothetical protein
MKQFLLVSVDTGASVELRSTDRLATTPAQH